MPSLWRRIRQSKSKAESTSGKLYESDGSEIGSDSSKGLESASNELPQNLVRNGRAMQLLRQVHLVDPVHSPSWSGLQRTDQTSPSILHLVTQEPLDPSGLFEVLQPGIVDLANNPNMICVRGLLLDTLKHIGPVADQQNTIDGSHEPPKWLRKLAVSTNSAALRDTPLNVVADTPRKSRLSPRAVLQEKYEDFMVSIFGLIENHLKKLPKPSIIFDNVKMCVTAAGFFGLVAPCARVGDNIFMVEQDRQCSVFVVRKHPVHGFYLWNGMVYIHHLAESVDNTYATDRIIVG
jgi:hypothetical protein